MLPCEGCLLTRLLNTRICLQLKEETERLEEEEGEMRKKLKATREHSKQWEQTRETRVRQLFCKLRKRLQTSTAAKSTQKERIRCAGDGARTSGCAAQVGTWRDFVTQKTKAKKSTALMGGIKPPKLKMEDDEHTYIQRSVQQQWRPKQPKPAGPQGKPPPRPPPRPQGR